jgi:pimeloyl-ACP methyl ester carboxylesterase
MGHSFGGLVTQILLDRGLGAAGVAIDPAPPKGVLVIPPASLRVASVSLRNPANRHRAQMLTAKQFHFAFGNTLSQADSQAVYERYAVPGPGRTLFQAGLANFNPKAATKINFHNDDRAPLLILGGGKDHTVPAASTRSNFKLQQKSAAVTEYKEYADRSHYTCGEPGWEAVADHALEWAVAQAAKRAIPH